LARKRDKRNVYRLVVGKREGKRPLARPRRRWVGNINTDLVEIGWDGEGSTGLIQGRKSWELL
jgi:hypothetical protein